MSISEAIYNNSPVLLQNMLISGYGYSLKRLRYGGEYSKNLVELDNNQFKSAAELKQIQAELFEKLVKRAVSDSPFYIDLIQNNGVDPVEISIDNYQKVFPIITKELLRQRQKEFYCKNLNNQKRIHISTSGTSGTPLNILTSPSALQRNYAFFNRFLNSAGVGFGDKCATFAGRVFIPSSQNVPPYWRHNLSSNTLLLSSYHLSERSIPEYIKAMERFNPKFIDSYPSALYEIAKFVLSRNYTHKIAPAAIITSSETLFDYQREAIEAAFQSTVFDHFGCAEMSILITQCERGRYHVNPEYGIFEVLDENDQPVDDEIPGRLICTGLVNSAMPLIRYELGDSIAMSSGDCECGRHFPVVKSIVGRTDDLITGCDGRKIGRLDPMFKKMDTSIKEAQVIQTDLTHIVLRMVTESHYDKANTNELVKELHSRLGDCMEVEVDYVDAIERTSSGKFRAVISHVPKSENNLH